MRRPRRDSLVVALAVGVVLGVATRYVYELPAEWRWLHRVGVPWLAVAFAVGALARRPGRGAVGGVVCLVAGVLVYYAAIDLAHGPREVTPFALGWSAIAVPGGAAFGALGALYAGGRARVLASSVLTAAFVGEAVLFALLVPAAGRPGTILLAVALALPFLLLRRARERALALASSAVLAGAAVVAEGSVFALTKYVG